jgi:hypothetical protein
MLNHPGVFNRVVLRNSVRNAITVKNSFTVESKKRLAEILIEDCSDQLPRGKRAVFFGLEAFATNFE